MITKFYFIKFVFGTSWLRIRTNFSDPDPAKSFGSFRIRIHNDPFKSFRIHNTGTDAYNTFVCKKIYTFGIGNRSYYYSLKYVDNSSQKCSV